MKCDGNRYPASEFRECQQLSKYGKDKFYKCLHEEECPCEGSNERIVCVTKSLCKPICEAGNPCQNNGKCINKENLDYQCVCKYGNGGKDCELFLGKFSVLCMYGFMYVLILLKL